MLLTRNEGTLADPKAAGRPGLSARLVLTFGAQELRIDPGECVLLGTVPEADLRLDRPHVSRSHLRILRRERYFVAIDHSTNGTFLQTEDRAVTHFKRAEQRLWGRGWLSLGEALSEASAIRFQVLEGP